jgi:NADH:ubiquinone oxidoreductase subunit E
MEKKKITICMGSSCFSRGNKDNLIIIQDYLKNNDSAEVLLTGALCQEKCSKGPVLYLGDTMHCSVDPDHLPDLLNGYISADGCES